MYLKKVDEIFTNHKIDISYLLYFTMFSFSETAVSGLKPLELRLESCVICCTNAPHPLGQLSKGL